MRVGQTSAFFFVANITSSVIAFGATIYFTRTLEEDLLGTYFLALAVLIWASVVLGRPIQSAVTKRLSESGDTGFLTAGYLLQTGVFVVCVVLVFLFRSELQSYLGVDFALPLLVLLFVSLSLKYVKAALQGEHRMHVASGLQPINFGLRSIVQVVAIALGFQLAGLFFGYGLAGAVATIVGIVFLQSRPTLPTREHFERLASFARYSWLGKISSRAFSSLDTLVLGLFVAKGLITYYEIAWNLASIFAIFGVGISQTMFPEISKLSDGEKTEQIETLIEDALTYAGLLLIPGFVGSLIIGDLILKVYGEGYATASTVLVVLVGARLVYIYANQLMNALNGINRPDLAFRVNGAFLVVNVSQNLLLVYLFDWIGAAVATTLSAVVSLALAYRYLESLVTVRVPLREVSIQWLAALAMGVVVLVARTPLPETWLAGFGLAAIGAVVYFGLLYLLSDQFKRTVRNNLPESTFT